MGGSRGRTVGDRLTLRVLIDDWSRLHLAGQRPRYAAEAVRALHHALADTLDDAAEESRPGGRCTRPGRPERRRARQSAGKVKGAAITGRTVAYGRAAFAWARKRGMVASNPFADLPVAKSIAKRDRVLTDEEVAEVWQAAGEADATYATIIRLLILTGQRRGEVEISDDLRTWTMPSHRTKNGVPHMVALSGPARDLLRGLLPKDATEAKRALAEWRAGGLLVLPGLLGTPFAGWSKAKAMLDRAIFDARAEAASAAGAGHTPIAIPIPIPPWSIHDLRRTVATGLQYLGVRLEVAEAVLNHISGNRAGIAGVYQRHDWAAEKRAALDGWATHVLAIVGGRPYLPTSSRWHGAVKTYFTGHARLEVASSHNSASS
jgi:integrase